MKSKAPLLLMEQMIMLLVFALAAALCLQAFVRSDEMSRQSEDRDRAVTLCQSAAEAVRHSRGDLEKTMELMGFDGPWAGEQSLFLAYDADWSPFGVGDAFGKDALRGLRITPVDSGMAGLGKAQVEAFAWNDEDGTARSLFRIEVAWQEVTRRG